MAERNRDSHQSDFVHGCGNYAEDQTTRCRLADEVADRHAHRNARVFPRIRSLPVPDEQSLDQRRYQENWQENQHNGTCGLPKQFVETEVEFYRMSPSHLVVTR